MPVYEYFCRTCHTRYEKLRAMADADAPVNCPACQEQDSVRVLSVFVAHTAGGRASEGPSSTTTSTHSGGCGCGACTCGAHSMN